MNPRVNNNSESAQHHLYHVNPTTAASSYNSCYRGCCCCLFLLLSFLSLLLLAALLVIVFAVKPKRPHLDLREVGLQYMSIAPSPNHPGPATPNLYLIIQLAFAVVNPNGVGIKCGESRVTLVYRGTPLGRTTVAAFWQHPHTVKKVVATVDVDDVNLSNADSADFARDALLNDRVELRVLTHVATKIRLFNLYSPPLQVAKENVYNSIAGGALQRLWKKNNQRGNLRKTFEGLKEEIERWDEREWV